MALRLAKWVFVGLLPAAVPLALMLPLLLRRLEQPVESLAPKPPTAKEVVGLLDALAPQERLVAAKVKVARRKQLPTRLLKKRLPRKLALRKWPLAAKQFPA